MQTGAEAVLILNEMKAILRIAIRNTIRNSRKSSLIFILIAVSVAISFLANSFLENTKSGLKDSYIDSLTGDLAITEKGDFSFSLFGTEVPIVSQYEKLPAISDYASVADRLNSLGSAFRWTSIVSGAARFQIGELLSYQPVFGVEPGSYFNTLDGLAIVKGDIAKISDGGVFITEALARRAEIASGRPVELGEPIIFSMQAGDSFTIRKGRLAGIFSYANPNEVTDNIVLADPVILRSLLGYTLGYAKPGALRDDLDVAEGFVIDDLFSDAQDFSVAGSAEAVDPASLMATAGSGPEALVPTDDAAWNFILIRAPSGGVRNLKASLTGALGELSDRLSIMGWQRAAGSSVLLVLAVQGIFFAGLAIVVLIIVLIIVNALVISVMERSAEIGTMRSLGASAGFIRGLFLLESLILSFFAALAGITIAWFAAGAIGARGIILSNPMLASMFGGSALKPAATLRGALVHLVAALTLGGLAWIYPVFLASRVSPVTAMNKG